MATVDPPGPPAFAIEDLPGPAFLLAGPQGRVSEHNAAFSEWAGRPDLRGLSLADLFPGDPGVARLWEEAHAAGSVEHYVERRGRGGGSSFWSLRAGRTPAGVLVCAGDLTAVAAAAHAVHAAEREYVAVAAHELRAPLSAIKAWASALDVQYRERHRVEAHTAEGLDAIARQVDRMNELLTDLFDAARAGAGSLQVAHAEVAVDALVRRAVAASPHAAPVVVPAALPGRAVVDAVQMEAVLGRVLGWVAARRQTGSIVVGAEPRPGEVHVVVSDPGPELSRVAEGELFSRSLRNRRSRGLGLYLCQQLAAASGGRLFRERTREGARFVLALPETAPPPPSGEPGHAQVLVGDPDRVRRGRAVAALRLDGHEAAGAADGARLFRSLDERAFDVVVVDLLMPGTGGVAEGLARIRARPSAPAVIVIAPSGERPEALDGAERAGALAVLTAPVDWPHLLSLVGCAAASRAG